MVDKAIGNKIEQNFNISFKSKQTSFNSKVSFEDVLNRTFKEQTAKLTHIPGMPGVYSANPQTLASLNILEYNR